MRQAQWLPRELEKARYDQHENGDSEGYRQFLKPVFDEIEAFCTQSRYPCDILDYGCGPTAFFAKWLEEEGLGPVAKYDLHYFTDQGALQRPFDVLVCTEVWEHFHHPQEELEQLTKLLKPGGIFAVATATHPVVDDISVFYDWYYRRDLTHVVFYSETSMKWIAKKFGLVLLRATSPYWIFQKPVAK
jgi:SAM-dependent methyltransferase